MFRPRLIAVVVTAALLPFAPVQSEDLLEVYDLAEQNDPQLRAALQNRLAVQEELPIARSGLYPQVGAGAGLDYNRTELKSGGPSGVSSIDGTGRNLGLTLSQTIYNRIETLQVDVAETEVLRANIDYSNAEQELILRTAQAYFGVLKANAQVQLAEADQAAVQRQLDQAQQRFEVGLIAITDVADAKAQFDSARAQTITARNALNNAMAQLATLTGRSFDTLADVSTSLSTPQPEPADIDAWIEAALEQNLTLRSAQLGSDLARSGVEINRAQRLPTVGLNASYGYNHAPSQSTGGELETLNGSVGIELEVPLYTSGRINAQTRQATYRFQESIDQVESVRREARRGTETAYRNVMTNISEISAYRQAVESARTSLA
ncbi:MAG: TolC family outer membrane protein, partial [Halothiobacillaceae bacterium]